MSVNLPVLISQLAIELHKIRDKQPTLWTKQLGALNAQITECLVAFSTIESRLYQDCVISGNSFWFESMGIKFRIDPENVQYNPGEDFPRAISLVVKAYRQYKR